VQGNSSARDGQITSPVLTAQRPPLPQPPGSLEQGRQHAGTRHHPGVRTAIGLQDSLQHSLGCHQGPSFHKHQRGLLSRLPGPSGALCSACASSGEKTCSHCDLPPRPPQQLHRRARWRAATAVLRPTCTAGAPAPAAAQRDCTGLSSSGSRAVRVRKTVRSLCSPACPTPGQAPVACLARPGVSPGAQSRARARARRDLHALRAPPTHARPAARRTRCTTTLDDRSRCVLLVRVQPRYLSSLLAARTGPGERPTRRACICTQVALSIYHRPHACSYLWTCQRTWSTGCLAAFNKTIAGAVQTM